MDLLLYLFIVLCVPLSFISAESNSTSSGLNSISPLPSAELSSPSEKTLNSSLETSPGKPTTFPSAEAQSNGLTMLAFGVMSFILVLIIVMVILVTVVNLRGQCHSTKEEGVKGYDSVISESNRTSSGEKESITLVSVRTINTDTDTDSPQISSVHSTLLENESQELSRDLLNIRAQ